MIQCPNCVEIPIQDICPHGCPPEKLPEDEYREMYTTHYGLSLEEAESVLSQPTHWQRDREFKRIQNGRL